MEYYEYRQHNQKFLKKPVPVTCGGDDPRAKKSRICGEAAPITIFTLRVISKRDDKFFYELIITHRKFFNEKFSDLVANSLTN